MPSADGQGEDAAFGDVTGPRRRGRSAVVVVAHGDVLPSAVRRRGRRPGIPAEDAGRDLAAGVGQPVVLLVGLGDEPVEQRRRPAACSTAATTRSVSKPHRLASTAVAMNSNSTRSLSGERDSTCPLSFSRASFSPTQEATCLYWRTGMSSAAIDDRSAAALLAELVEQSLQLRPRAACRGAG